jgi:hypothetical protein
MSRPRRSLAFTLARYISPQHWSKALCAAGLCCMLPACADSEPGMPGPPAPSPDPQTIRITMALPPALVAFQDGVDTAWQRATMTGPGAFEVEVHLPYIVAVVCTLPMAPGDAAGATTFLIARSLDDPHDLTVPCDPRPVRRSVSGLVAQAGRVQIADQQARSQTDSWSFELRVPDGTHDLIATTADRIAVRRGIAVNGDVVVTSPIDVVQEGTQLTDVGFRIENAAPEEILTATVGLETVATSRQALVYIGPITVAKVIPDSALLATDRQSATLLAQNGNARRGVRRPFRVGGDADFTLPAAIEGVQWTVNDGVTAVSWTSLPDLDSFEALVFGRGASVGFATYSFGLTRRFVSETRIRRIVFDTDILDYRPEWKVDITRLLQRELFGEAVAGDEILVSAVTENFN